MNKSTTTSETFYRRKTGVRRPHLQKEINEKETKSTTQFASIELPLLLPLNLFFSLLASLPTYLPQEEGGGASTFGRGARMIPAGFSNG